MKRRLPNHVAIIMDGNRRWANLHKLQLYKGHEKGARRVHEIIKEHFSKKISYLTVWAASIDNLTKRSKTEVKFLARLLQKEAEELLNSEEFLKNKIRVRFIGKWKEIIKNKELDAIIASVEKKTENFKNGNFTILFGYDGNEEMLSAIKEIKARATPKLDYESMRYHLSTRELPPVDLVIRTGGEPHWSSGFMMWHTANSQFYFTKKLWPEFNVSEYKKALADFTRRRKKFGA